jgi:hypothetical protein
MPHKAEIKNVLTEREQANGTEQKSISHVPTLWLLLLRIYELCTQAYWFASPTSDIENKGLAAKNKVMHYIKWTPHCLQRNFGNKFKWILDLRIILNLLFIKWHQNVISNER